MSIFFDANILFSASYVQSNFQRFFYWIAEREILVTSRYAAEEAKRNISIKRPAWIPGYERIMQHIKLIDEAQLQADVSLAQKDQPILGAAIAARCQYLVTSDKRDFGHLYNHTIEGVTIISYLRFAEIMLDKHAS